VTGLVLLSLAFAQPTVGTIDLQVSPGAEVVQFPRAEPSRVDLALYHNRVGLDEQLDHRTTRHLTQAWASSVGAGTWFVTLHVDGPDVGVTWALDGGTLRLTLAPGAPPPSMAVPDALDIATLLDAPPPRRPLPPPSMALHPLWGDASTMTMAPEQAFVGMPKVSTPQVATYRSSLAAIDTYRDVWATAEEPETRAAALARIAIAYGNLDLHRDALHYFERALEMGRSDAPLVLAMARTQVAMGHAGAARSSCRYAARRGAEPDDVLACLGGVALLNGSSSPSHLGRALAATTNDPHRRLLAAQLLLADFRHGEALPMLERLAEGGDPRAAGSLGDARFAAGDIPGAVEAWRGAARGASLRESAKLRMRMAEMIQAGPGSFPEATPMLFALADQGGLVGAEAHYLLIQVAAVHADPDLLAEQANQLWDEDPARVMRSDVPERLVSTCGFRMRQLADRPVDALGFFESCWRRELDGMVTDPTSLDVASRAMGSLGLPDDAMRLQLRAMTVRTRQGQDDPMSLLWLAELYARTGSAQEALETVMYVKGLRIEDAAVVGERLRVEGLAHEALEDPNAALKSWEAVPEATAARAPAQLARGLLLARLGRCEEALQILVADVETALPRSRCLLVLGRADAARAVFGDDPLPDPLSQEDAEWLASVAAWRDGKSPEKPVSVWAALAEEEAKAEAFDKRRRPR
jgi:tetratricopeptide (TPR) repeat protein